MSKTYKLAMSYPFKPLITIQFNPSAGSAVSYVEVKRSLLFGFDASGDSYFLQFFNHFLYPEKYIQPRCSFEIERAHNYKVPTIDVLESDHREYTPRQFSQLLTQQSVIDATYHTGFMKGKNAPLSVALSATHPKVIYVVDYTP